MFNYNYVPHFSRVGDGLGAGGILSTANDMAKYTAFHLNKGKVGDTQVVSAVSIYCFLRLANVMVKLICNFLNYLIARLTFCNHRRLWLGSTNLQSQLEVSLEGTLRREVFMGIMHMG